MASNSEHIATLVPALRPLAAAFLDRARVAGFDIVIYESYRSLERQAALYAVGRGQYIYNGTKYLGDPNARVITNARPGQSLHNQRRAFDCYDRNKVANGAVQWNSINWAALAAIGESLGLTAGHRWAFKDSPHFEYHGLAEAQTQSKVPTPIAPPQGDPDVLPPQVVAQEYRDKVWREAESAAVLLGRRQGELYNGFILEWQENYKKVTQPLPPEVVRQLYRDRLGREPENEEVLKNRHWLEWLDNANKELLARLNK